MNRKELQYQQHLIATLNSRVFSRRSMVMGAGAAAASLSSAGYLTRAGAQDDATPGADIGIGEAVEGTPLAPPDDGMIEFEGPVDVLNYALTLEHLEATFYREGLGELGTESIEGLGFDASVFDRLTDIGDHEAAHVETLTAVINDLGGTPVEEGAYDFGYTDAAGFLEVALALEDTGVAAYGGAAQFLIEEDGLLTAALTIHGVEARHAAYLALLNAISPFPSATNPTLTPAEVLEIAGPFIVEG